MSPYAPRIALLALLPVLISAKSLPTWTVVGMCDRNVDSFVVWVQAENATMALLEMSKGKYIPIDAFEGKQRGYLSKGQCD